MSKKEYALFSGHLKFSPFEAVVLFKGLGGDCSPNFRPAGVLHVPSIKPLNVEEFVKACEPFKLVMTVEEHNFHGGLGALVAEILSEHSPRRVIRFGIKDRWGESAPNEYLLVLFELSPARLSERIKQVLLYTK